MKNLILSASFIFALAIFSLVVVAASMEISIEYPPCAESWECNQWSSCSAGSQSRACIDINNCGTTTSKPVEFQSCVESSVITPSGGGGGGGSSGVVGRGVSAGNVLINPTPKQSGEIPQETQVVKKSSVLDIQVEIPETVEMGDQFTATITFLATEPISTNVEVFGKIIGVVLEKDVPKTISVEIDAPEAEGTLNLFAVTPYATGNKTTSVVFSPLVSSLKKIDGDTYLLNVKSFDNQSTTEIEVSRGGRTVYLDYVEGSYDYKVNITLSEPGEYILSTKARSVAGTIDEDSRRLVVEGVPGFDFGFAAFVIITILIAGVILWIRRG